MRILYQAIAACGDESEENKNQFQDAPNKNAERNLIKDTNGTT